VVEQVSPNKVPPLTIGALYALSTRATDKQSEVQRTMTDQFCLVRGNFSKQVPTQQASRQTTPCQSSSTKQCTRAVKDEAKGVVSRDQSRGQDQRGQIALSLGWLTFSRVQRERESLRKCGEKDMRMKLVYIKRQSLYKFKYNKLCRSVKLQIKREKELKEEG